METSNRHKGESRKQIKANLEPPLISTPEGRVSAARRNPKSMRRSTGL